MPTIEAQSFAPALDTFGLASPGDIAGVTTTHGRALCFRVTLRDGRELFVKQARAGAEAALAHEAAIVAAVTDAGVDTARLLGFDEATATAVYESVAHGTSLPEVHDRLGPDEAAALGEMVARVHLHTRATALPLRPTGRLGRASTEWMTMSPKTISMYPAAHRELWIRLGIDGQDALGALAEGWRDGHLIHADVKDDNIFLTATGAVLIDWETAGWGDPRWDLGCLLGGQVLGWIHGMDLEAGADLASWIASAQAPLEHIAERCRDVLTGYRRAGELCEADVVTTVGFAGAFLAHRGLSVSMQATRLPGHSHLGVHLARQFLLHPNTIREMLL